jgi:uncharacterized membrane protein
MGFSRWSFLLLAALALNPAAHAQTTFDTYRLTHIGEETFGIANPVVAGINEKGEMAAATQFPEPQRALLLRDGMVIELGDLMGGASPDAYATAINDLTQITGVSAFPDATGFTSRGFLWEAGQIRNLGPDVVSAEDINNRGQIVGHAVTESGRAVPILWEGGRTTFLEPLPCPSGAFGVARAINENGVIVGASAGSGGTRAVMWRNGEVMVLAPTFPRPFPREDGEAVDVNDRNEAIGSYRPQMEPENTTSFLWSEGGVTVLPPLDRPEGNEAALAGSINNEGQILGATFYGSGATVATLWQEGAVVDLNALISDDDPLKPFVTLTSAGHGTESGVILASGQDSRDPEVAQKYYLLTPTGASSVVTASPPPSSDADSGGGAVDLLSLLLLILGLSSLARCQRGRRARPFG